MKPRAMTVAEFRARGLSVDASGRVSKSGAAKKPKPKGPARPRKVHPLAMGATDDGAGAWLLIPLVTGRGQNEREHPMVRTRRVKREHRVTELSLHQLAVWSARVRELRHAVGVARAARAVVTITRLSPSAGKLVDRDNGIGGTKEVRDQIATWLGVDDGDEARVLWEYDRARSSAWGVRVEFRRHEEGATKK